MGGTPNVAGMLADPDFQGLAPGDKRVALTKLTGDQSFSALSDAETMQFVAKFPKPAAQPAGLPDTMAQSKAYGQRPLAQATQPTERAMQQTMGGPPMFVDIPAGQKQAFEQAGQVGYQKGARIGAENVGALALGEGAIAGIGRLLPSAMRAGTKFEAIKTAIGNLPVEGHLDQAAQVAWDTKALAGRGGRLPKVVSDFLKRMYDPKEGPMTYNEVRDFYQNASRLSADEFGRLTPVMQRQSAMFAKALDSGIREATAIAGKGEEYAGAIREYARAARLSALGEKAVGAGKTALKDISYGAKLAAGGGAVYELYRALAGGKR